MKRKSLQNTVLSKYQKGDDPTDVHRHLNGGISLATINRRYQIIRHSSSIQLQGTYAAPPIVRALKRIYKK